jgi:hypothetical protein
MPLDLFNRLERVLFFADKVADEHICEETKILEKTIPRMFETMQRVARFACDYVKRGRFGMQSLFLTWTGLIVAERVVGGLGHQGMIEEMDRELTEVIEDFDRAMNVETLRLAREGGKQSSCQSGHG